MNKPMFEVAAPGLYFAMTPQDNEDLSLIRVAVKDAVRRTRRSMRMCLPTPEQVSDTQSGGSGTQEGD